MFAPNKDSRILPYLRAGIATTRFRTVRRDVTTNTIYLPAYGYLNDGLTKTAPQNALAIPVAAGLSFKVTDNLFIEAEHCFSMTNSDILDAFIGVGSGNDIFGMTQLGLKFTIEPVSAPVARTRKVSGSSSGLETQDRSPARTSRRSKTTEDVILPETNILVQSLIPDRPVSGKIFEVKIKLNKDDYTDKAILTQSYPAGFTAMESAVGDAVFSFVNQKVRIIWENLPSDQVVEYSYLVRPSESVRGTYTINGSLEYRQPDGPRVVHFANYIDVANQVESSMDNRIFDLIGDKDKEQVTNQKETQATQQNNMDLKIEDLLRKYGGETRDQEVKTETQTNNNITTQGLSTGTEFRIQIGAFRDQAQGQSIIRRYNLPETVTEEFVDGLYKYTLGSFRSYNDAVRFRDQFIKRTQIWSAFIVAYENGIRVKNLNDLIK